MNRRATFFNSYLYVGISWLLGMMIGMVFAYSHKASIAPNCFGDIFMSTSFSGVIITSLLPICLAILAWWLKMDFLIYIVLLANGLLYGFCSIYLSYALGYAGCLSHLFCMFSQSCCATFLVILCPALMSGSQNGVHQYSLMILAASVFICLFDYFVILKLFKI